MRRGPGTSHTAFAVAHRGERYAVIETRGTWKRIWFDEGAGWVAARFTRTVQAPVLAVTAQALNVRTGPGVRYRRLGELVRHSFRVERQRSGNWTRIDFGGRSAWCASRYLAPGTAGQLADSRAAADRLAAQQAGGANTPPTSGVSGTVYLIPRRITANALNVRTGPGTTHPVIGIAHRDEIYVSFDVQGEWLRIWFDERAGWIHGRYARADSAPVQVVAAQRLNVRTGPGTSHGAIGQLVQHALVARQARSGGWSRISYGGRTGWVSDRYLTDPAAGTRTASLAAASGTGANGSNGAGTSTAGGTGGGSGAGSGAGTGAGASAGGGQGSVSIAAVEITAAVLNVREGPSAAARLLGTVDRGQVYVRFQRQGGWLRIWYDNGPGWIAERYTRLSQRPVRRVTARLLNVRSGPGTRYRRVGELPEHALVAVANTQGNWREIAYAGARAWVSGRYLAPLAASTGADTLAAANRFAPGGTGGGPGSVASSGNPQNLPSSRRGFLQLPASGPGFYSYAVPSRRWGRDYLVYGILRVGQSWSSTGYGRMGVGDLSYANGGPISGHRSHQKGVDVDVRAVRATGEGQVSYRDPAYSRAGTQSLVDLFYRYTPVTMIFFNDPHVRRVRYWPNHDHHFHVRVVER